MLTCIDGVLSKDDVAEFRRIMEACDWEDGRSTAGAQSALVKRNEQLPPDSEAARKLGNRVISALTASLPYSSTRKTSGANPVHKADTAQRFSSHSTRITRCSWPACPRWPRPV